MRVQVILNPAAGAGRAGGLATEIRSAFAARGITAKVVPTRRAGDALRMVADLSSPEIDAVVSAGGDGTLFEVVNGLCEIPQERRPSLGVIPLGTGNAFARDLGLEPWAWQSGVNLICDGKVRAVDLARVECRDRSFHCINILGCGFVVTAGMAARRFKRLGTAAYTAGVLAAMARLTSFPMRLEVDGEPLHLDALFATISNSRYTGTDFQIAPLARLDDGLLDLTLVRAVTRRRLLRLFPRVFKGSHITRPEVITRQARCIRLLAPDRLALSPDGEFTGTTPATITCVPGALRVFAPAFATPGALQAWGASQ